MTETIDARAVFVGLARDSAASLPAVLGNIERMAGLFKSAAFRFYENDSTDSTASDLAAWCARRANAELITLDGLSARYPQRTIRLAHIRDLYVEEVRARFSDHDYLFVIDCDNSNDFRIDTAGVTRAIEFLAAEPGRAAVFANQDGVYFDLWALRHADWCPADIWEEVLDQFARGGTDLQAFQSVYSKRMRTIRPNEAPISVSSAFGGLCITNTDSILMQPASRVGLKRKMLLNSQRPGEQGWQVCEHVSFNAGFGRNGESLHILPWLINRITADPFTALNGWIPHGAFRTFIFELPAPAEKDAQSQDS